MIATAKIKDAASGKYHAAFVYIQHKRRGAAPSQMHMLAALDGLSARRRKLPKQDLANIIGCHPADIHRIRWAIANNDWQGHYSTRPAKQWSLP